MFPKVVHPLPARATGTHGRALEHIRLALKIAPVHSCSRGAVCGPAMGEFTPARSRRPRHTYCIWRREVLVNRRCWLIVPSPVESSRTALFRPLVSTQYMNRRLLST